MRFLFIFIILVASQFVYAGTQPELIQESAHNLKPTQAVIGMIEVNAKAEEFIEMSREERIEYLYEHPIPVIIGPGNHYYMIDRHHMSRALVESGHKKLFIHIQADWSKMSTKNFWQKMEANGFVYLYDAAEKKINPQDLPTHISELKDDPYRSLSYYARKAGAYAKFKTPFIEFQWAHFYRKFISIKELKDWNAVIKKTISISKTKAASQIPGYTGPINSCVKFF